MFKGLGSVKALCITGIGIGLGIAYPPRQLTQEEQAAENMMLVCRFGTLSPNILKMMMLSGQITIDEPEAQLNNHRLGKWVRVTLSCTYNFKTNDVDIQVLE